MGGRTTPGWRRTAARLTMGLFVGLGLGARVHAGEPEPDTSGLREVSLADLFPSPPPEQPSTFAVPRGTNLMPSERTAPEGDYRERMEDVAVPSQCVPDCCGGAPTHCFDGLKDLRTGRVLIPVALTKDEKRVLASKDPFPGYMQRGVRLAYVSQDYVSVYSGYSELSGGAHANNFLECLTFDRRTGKRVTLSQVVPPARAKALLQKARALLRSYEDTHQSLRHTLKLSSFLYDSAHARIVLCPEADFIESGTTLEVPLSL